MMKDLFDFKKGFTKGLFKFGVREVVALGIGAALFFVLGRFVSVPTFVPNTNVETAYAFLALLAVVFGPIVACLAGFIGHALKDFTMYGGTWWSWIITSAAVGFIIGTAKNLIDIKGGEFGYKQIITFNCAQFVANAVGWFLIAPTLDVIIYAEPADKVYLQGLVAGVGNIVTVAIIGTILLFAYAKAIPKSGSLKKEE